MEKKKDPLSPSLSLSLWMSNMARRNVARLISPGKSRR